MVFLVISTCLIRKYLGSQLKKEKKKRKKGEKREKKTKQLSIYNRELIQRKRNERIQPRLSTARSRAMD